MIQCFICSSPAIVPLKDDANYFRSNTELRLRVSLLKLRKSLPRWVPHPTTLGVERAAPREHHGIR